MAYSGQEKIFQRLVDEKDSSLSLLGLRAIALVGSWLYGLGASLNNLFFDLGIKKNKRLICPVIGVGNLTVGGTGKTPLVMAIAKALRSMELFPAIISRGYKGKTQGDLTFAHNGQKLLAKADLVGDEPALMAKRLQLPVAVGKDRFLVGKKMIDVLGPRVFIGDDLYQHRKLYRDFNILTMDADHPIGNGRLLPAGILREPLSGIRRADAIVLTHADNPKSVQKTKLWLRTCWGKGPILSCCHRLQGLTDESGKVFTSSESAKMPVLAFCGLGKPKSFKKGLLSLGLDIKGFEEFSDHHAFTEREINALWQKALYLGAKALVTSEKDAMRIKALPKDAKLLITRLTLEFNEGPKALEKLLVWGLKDWGK